LAAAVEEAGINVGIYDCEAKDNSEESLAFYMRENRPKVVGISIITTNFRGALETAKIVRRELPDTIIVAGGSHLMIFPEETLSFSEFDFGFIGEAEKPLVNFLSCFQKAGVDFSQIAGLVWKSENGIRINEPYGFNQELDSLPIPAYHLIDLAAYRMPNTNGNVISLFHQGVVLLSAAFASGILSSRKFVSNP